MGARKAILLFGGDSDERLVSVASAQNLAKQYDWDVLYFFSPEMNVHEISKFELLEHPDAFHNAFLPISAGLSFQSWLVNQSQFSPNSTYFLGFHGGDLENGVFQTELEQNRLRYTGSRARSSALCFSKTDSKNKIELILNEVPSLGFLADSEVYQISARTPDVLERLGVRLRKNHLVLKPNQSGSSVGLFFVHTEAELRQAVSSILEGQIQEYIVEDLIVGCEVTVGIMETEENVLKALPATEVVLEEGRHFDYEGKYLGRGTKEITPARISSAAMLACQNFAKAAHVALGCRGYSRTDFILTDQGPYFLELNTLPGLTAASFLPQQLQAAGISMHAFISIQLGLA